MNVCCSKCHQCYEDTEKSSFCPHGRLEYNSSEEKPLSPQELADGVSEILKPEEKS